MAESTTTNLTREEIQMRDFVTVYGIEGLYIICVQSGGEGAKLAPNTLVSALTTSIKPSISDSGYWFIGSTETGVLARAKTPLLTADGSILQWKYEGEPDEMLRVLADLANYVFKFEDLTPEQRDSISLHFSQLTEAEIAQLQQPAKDMIAQLSETNKEATAAEETRQRNEETRQSQEAKRQSDTATAISNSESATEKALEVASNPTYIGTDMYVYEYDLATHTFNKTDKAMKIHFKIEYVYSSVAELEADQPVGKMDGLFAIISSNTEDPDNAKLYTSKSGKWVYLTDMSGFRGFRGFTPQLSIGTITFGSNRTDAAVSLSENGTDEEGNPRYFINLRIPSFAYSDLTPEQIAELQKPATDKAAEVQAAENKRVAAEKARVEAEKARAQEHTTKMNEASTATSKANDAAKAATTEAGKATSAAEKANAATDAAKKQTDLAKELNEHPQKQGDNGNWWKWNPDTDQYEDTGIIARGGAMYPTFFHRGNALYMQDHGSNIEERVAIRGNALVLLF